MEQDVFILQRCEPVPYMPTSLTPDRERWAEALAIERIHGDQAPAFIARLIGALAQTGDTAGVERFIKIATKLDQLIRSDGQQDS